MGWYQDHILPRCIDWVMRNEPNDLLRNSLLKEVKGAVLEVGFGSGLNLPHYSSQVDRLYALDPSLLGRRLAQPRIEAAPFPVEFVELEDHRFALPDQSVDAVVSTWTLCTIPDPVAALREILRVLKSDGRYYFLEHGLSPERRVARFQQLWNPIQKTIGGGCHVNRKIDRLILDSGLHILEQSNFYNESPKFLSYMYRGMAGPGAQQAPLPRTSP